MKIRDEIMDLWVNENGDIRGTSKDFELLVFEEENKMYLEVKLFYKGYEYSFSSKAHKIKKIES